MSREKKEQKRVKKGQNETVACFMLNEVRFEPGVEKLEKILDILFLFLVPLITALCVLWSAFSCCELDIDVPLFVAVVVGVQAIIFTTIYYCVMTGKNILLIVELVAINSAMIVYWEYIKDGLLYVADKVINLFNVYKDETYVVTEELASEEEKAIFIFLLAVATIELLAINYIFICYTSRSFFITITLPIAMISFFVGLTPETIPFVIYIGIVVSLLATKNFKKKRTDSRLAKNKMFQKSFLDAPIIRAMAGTMLCYAVVASIVSLVLPDKYEDDEFMRQRHIAFEESSKDSIENQESKFSLDIKIIDRILGADDIKREIDDDKKSPATYNTNGSDFNIQSVIDSLTGDVDRNELFNNLSKKVIDGSSSFYNSYVHGDLSFYKGTDNLNTGKLYTLYVEKNDNYMGSQYIKNYVAQEYNNGKWKNYHDSYDIDEVDYEYDMDREFYNSFIEYQKLYSLDSELSERNMVLATEANFIDDSVYKYFIPSAGTVEKDGKISYIYSIIDDVFGTDIQRPYSLGAYINDNLYSRDVKEMNVASCDQMMLNASEISKYNTIYDMYTSIPDTDGMAKFKQDVINEYEEFTEYEAKTISYYDGAYSFEDTSDSGYDNYNKYLTWVSYFVSYKMETGFSYTLNPKVTEGVDPVLDFYYNTHEGYCMHFASTAAMMYRSLGIPARYVEGYMVEGSRINNELDDTENGDMAEVSVYGTDAHAWIEIYVRGLGWVPQEVTLGYTDDVNDFAEEAEKYRKSKNPKGEVSEKDTPTKSPSETPSDKPEETVKPSSEPTATAPSNIDDQNNSDNDTQATTKKVPKFVWIIMVIVVIIGMIATSIKIIAGKRKKYINKLKLSKPAYKYINKALLREAKNNNVYWNSGKDYIDFAKEFADKDENMDYEDALKFVEIARRSVYSQNGILEEDVITLRKIYNGYMEKVSGKWNKLQWFINVKIKGVITKL